MLTSKLEILIDYGPKTDEAVINKTIKDLKAIDGVKEAVFKDGAVVVETSLPSSVVLDLVSKSSGKRTVLQGFGEFRSAVAMVSNHSCRSSKVVGVVRFQQDSDDGPLVVDGTIDGLNAGEHMLSVHESGDLSQGCKSIGHIFNPPYATGVDSARPAGDLGVIKADDSGRAAFRKVVHMLKVWDIIGRAVAVSERIETPRPHPVAKDGNWASVACGIIARSAGIFQNAKRVCACDGVVVWDERDRPLAGAGRRAADAGGASERGDAPEKKCSCKY